MFCPAFRKLRFLCLIGAVATWLGCADGDLLVDPASDAPVAEKGVSPSNSLLGAPQWVIVLESGASAQSFANDHGLVTVSVLNEADLYLFQGPGDLSALQADPRVQSAEPNDDIVFSEPVDLIMGFYEGSWSESTYPGQSALSGLHLDQVHRVATGNAVTVAVLDTGVDPTHPHLSDQVLLNPIPFLGQSETVPNGLDDDGDGQVDEAFGHGTHVAGIIATVAPGAKILPIRVLNDDGVGTAFDLAVGLYEALFLQADIVNLSLSLNAYSPVIANLLQLLDAAGIRVVAAAGNTGTDPKYPATDAVTVGVAALDSHQLLATFSGRGNVPLGAPGVDVVSSFPGGQLAQASGTSMACAVVSGSLALLIERGRSTSSQQDPRAELFQTATPITPAESVLYGAVSPTRALGIKVGAPQHHHPSASIETAEPARH